MRLDLSDSLSYMIKTDGECVAFMPNDEEFSISQLRDAVAGPPEVVFFTPHGYALFHNRDAKLKGLPVNEVATSLCREDSVAECEKIFGRVFLAHPRHIPAFWGKTNTRSLITPLTSDIS
jgi:hypothetical protein